MDVEHNELLKVFRREMEKMVATAVETALKNSWFSQVLSLPSNKRFLTPKDVEAEYGFKRRLLTYWRHENMGPPYKAHGRRVFYEREALEKFVKECHFNSASNLLDLTVPKNLR